MPIPYYQIITSIKAPTIKLVLPVKVWQLMGMWLLESFKRKDSDDIDQQLMKAAIHQIIVKIGKLLNSLSYDYDKKKKRQIKITLTERLALKKGIELIEEPDLYISLVINQLIEQIDEQEINTLYPYNTIPHK